MAALPAPLAVAESLGSVAARALVVFVPVLEVEMAAAEQCVLEGRSLVAVPTRGKLD